MELPKDIDAVLKQLLGPCRDCDAVSVLAAEDEAYLTALIAAIRGGQRAVVIVEEIDEKLRYMFSNATRAEAVSILGKVIESTGRRLAEGEE
ncbi:MAG TPA: hypothetical protein VMS32_01360 [Verrucomicrobiae bacterium]|nr:hypothetical protein [Verrucomicrobiae bacterium]